MHFIYYINGTNSHESRFNLFGLINQQCTAYNHFFYHYCQYHNLFTASVVCIVFLYYRLVNYKTFVYTVSKYVLCNYIIVCNNLL